MRNHCRPYTSLFWTCSRGNKIQGVYRSIINCNDRWLLMNKFTYLCNGSRVDTAYCEKGNEELILSGWNRLGKRTGHSYVMIKIEKAEDARNFEFRQLGLSKQFVRDSRH